MKIRLAGVYADFTGDFGVLSFVNGLSTRDVTALEGRRMGILVACSTEDGKNPLDHTVDWGGVGIPTSISPELTRIITVADQQKIDAAAALASGAEPASAPKEPEVWTRERLEAIADESGISGIREISDQLGIKGISIRGLIDQILSGKVVIDDTMPNQDVTTKV